MYLFIRLGRQTQRRWHVKSFCEHRKLAGENKLWKQACGTPDGCEWRHSFLACVRSAAVSSPQADTCGFNQLYMDPLLHSASASFPPPQSPACVSSFIPSVSSVLLFLLLWQPPSFLSQYIVSFYISHILCQHLFCIVSPFFPIFFFLAVPFPCRFLSPEHISGLCTCHSSLLGNLWTVFLQGGCICVTAGCLIYLSHPTALRGLRQKNIFLLSREMRCVYQWMDLLHKP